MSVDVNFLQYDTFLWDLFSSTFPSLLEKRKLHEEKGPNGELLDWRFFLGRLLLSSCCCITTFN